MDKELIQGINSGDKKAFNEVFDEYFNALCAFSFKYIPDQTATEDIVQDVFIAFWERNKEFDHLNAAKAFLYTSTRNKCLNYLKHQLVLQKHQEALIYVTEP